MSPLLGIEKVLPKLADLALFLPMLATAGSRAAAHLLQHPLRRAAPARANPTARRNSTSCCSTTSRTELLADAEQRDALHCIRCGACLNVCPDLQEHRRPFTYGTTYQGPDRLRHHAASARLAGLEAPFLRLARFAAPAPRPARSKSISIITCSKAAATPSPKNRSGGRSRRSRRWAFSSTGPPCFFWR